jgi:drug/metabolite transporter (DMT)-like permease
MKIIRTNLKEYRLLPFAILAISTASIFIRFAQYSLSSIVVAAYRMVFASFFLFPFSIIPTVHALRGKSIKEINLLFVSGIFLAMHFAAWIISLEYTTIIASVVLVTTTPIWVALLSPIITKENPSRIFWVGLSIAMIGIVIISVGQQMGINQINHAGSSKRMVGNSLALLGALCAAFYVIIGRILRSELSNNVYTFSVYMIAAIVLVLVVILIPGQSMMISVTDIKWLLLLALIPQLIGHTLINRFLGTMPAHQVSLFLLGEPVGAVVLALIFLKETPGIWEMIGALIILIGISIAISAHRTEK